MAVVPFSKRMSEDEYNREREKLRQTYGDSGKASAARRDQALALLFGQSDWTQEELARKEGISQVHIGRQLTFGRFLSFKPMGLKQDVIPQDFTERNFRKYWLQTDADKKEPERFREIIVALQLPDIDKKHVDQRKAIRNKFADGKWYPLSKIAEKLGDSKEHTKYILNAMKRQDKKVKVVSKMVGTEPTYKLYPITNTVSSAELQDKLQPIIKGLFVESKKNAATFSPGTIAHLASELQRRLDEWTSAPASPQGPDRRRKSSASLDERIA